MKKPVKSKKVRMHFPEIHHSVWEHPADKVALKTLQRVPGLDTIIRFFFGSTTEKSIRLLTLATAVRVNDKQFKHTNKLYEEVCRTLDVEDKPELFISQNPFLNAGAVGMGRPFIVLNSSMLDALSDEELMCVMGHELGHILSGHVLYKTVLRILLTFSTAAFSIPVSGVVLMGVIAALSEWDRKSELSADRAGLLVSQNPEVSIQLLMKLAGGMRIEEMDLGEFLKQAKEYKEMNALSDNIYKVLNTWQQSHPFPVIRVLELMEWVQQGEYDAVLRGFYSKEDSEYQDDVKKATDGYTKDFKETVSPVYEDLRNNAETAAKRARDIFGNVFGNQQG